MGDANTSAPTSGAAPTSAFAYTDLPMKVHYTDGSVHKEACITILASIDLEQNKLADLRDHIGLASDKKDSPLLGFCTKQGANVADAFSIKEYLKTGLGVDTDKRITVLVVYLKKEGLTTAESSLRAEVSSLGQYIDADKLARLKQHFDENAFKLLTGTAAKYVAELEEQEWSVVAENNALCYGMRFVREKSEGGHIMVGIERARYPAFRLKKRTILSDTLTSTSVKDVEMELRIPDYRVDDQSYVSTFETESRIQAALAQSSFSEVDVKAAASGSAFGCTVSGSAGFNTTSSSDSTSATEKTSKQVTIAYNFPRITVMLDRGDNLELTPACQTKLTSAMTSENADLMKEFLEDYGEIFSTQVQLGGRLFATEDVKSGSKEDAAQVAKSMKASAAASFSGWGAAVSASALYADKSSHSQSEKGSMSTRALAWQATGGDTLLCNDPPAWSASVAYHWNWRITKQDKVVRLISRLSKFRGFDTLLNKAKEWNIISEGDDGPGKDLQSTLKAESEKYQKFYLPRDEYRSSWLAVYFASERSLTRMADCWNNFPKVKIDILPSLANRGLCGLQNGRKEEDFEFQTETPDGRPVGEVSYRERYRLVNSKKKLYVDWYDTQDKYFLFANPVKGPVIEFRDKDAPEKTGPIPADAKITLNFYYRDDDTNDKGGLWLEMSDPSSSIPIDYVTLRKEYQTPLMFSPVE